jgi:hypothetical protein
MKPASSNSQNESTETLWPNVLQIASSDEFQQSFAVAQLAVKLCALKKAESKVPIEKENLDPKEFLAEAWELIQSAREHVLREQTNAEYLMQHDGSDKAGDRVLERILGASRVPFQELCDPKYKNKDDTKTIHGVKWIVYRSQHGFDDLFWAYWRETSILKLRMIMSASEVLGNESDKWENYGQQTLASWKRDGVPPNDFLALAKFRREHDKRAANLKKKPKGKRRRLMAKARA